MTCTDRCHILASKNFIIYIYVYVATCEWSVWSPWSTCTATCDGGVKTRERSFTPPDVECEGADEQSEACNVEPCGGRVSVT